MFEIVVTDGPGLMRFHGFVPVNQISKHTSAGEGFIGKRVPGRLQAVQTTFQGG
jgi:hypothetical protein